MDANIQPHFLFFEHSRFQTLIKKINGLDSEIISESINGTINESAEQ